MGRRGPPKKPTEQKILEGNPGEHALNKEQPEYEVETQLPCPSDIKGEGRKEWDRIAPMLIEFGVLKKADIHIFVKYCETISDLETFRKKFNRLDKRSAFFAENQITYMNMIIKLRTQLRHYAQELGLTPASRASVKASRPKGKNGSQQTSPNFKAGGNVARFLKKA